MTIISSYLPQSSDDIGPNKDPHADVHGNVSTNKKTAGQPRSASSGDRRDRVAYPRDGIIFGSKWEGTNMEACHKHASKGSQACAVLSNVSKKSRQAAPQSQKAAGGCWAGVWRERRW